MSMNFKLAVLSIYLVIYVLVLVGFNKARSKFAGGKIGSVINLILVTVILLFIGDYVLLFDRYLSEDTVFLVQTLFRTAGLSCLAFGGIRIAGD